MGPTDNQNQINANVLGIFWMILAGAAFGASNVAVRMAALDLHPFVIVFFRSILGFYYYLTSS